MAKKKKSRAVRAPSTAVEVHTKERKPKREVIEIHTTRESTRNASGVLGDKGGTIATVLGGVAGASAAVIASQKWAAHPTLVAGATAAAGLAAMSMGKQPWLRQAGAGAVVGAAVFGAVPLVVDMLSGQKSQPHTAQAAPGASGKKRSAEGGDGFVTRQELQDALGKMADSHKEVQQKQTCDLMTAFRDEVRKVIAEGPTPGTRALPAKQPQQSHTYPFRPTSDTRGAHVEDDYTRNAYGDNMRDAVADDYNRNAYGDDLRDALAAEERDASGFMYRARFMMPDPDTSSDDRNGDAERDASGEERDADVERDASGEERDADVERDASGEERDADVERDASGYEERDADGERDASGED